METSNLSSYLSNFSLLLFMNKLKKYFVQGKLNLYPTEITK